MRIALVFSLLIALIAVIFAFENPDPVNVEFLTLRSQEVPLAMVIILSLLTGVLVGALFSVPSRLRSRSRIKKLEKQIADAGGTPPPVEHRAAPSSSASSSSTSSSGPPAGGAAETSRLAAETQQMAADAQRRSTEPERGSNNP
jgi:putative membrane protein